MYTASIVYSCLANLTIHNHARYIDYLLEALKRRELFGWLRLDPRAAWHGLLFRDRHNWAGIAAPLNPELRTHLATTPGALSQVKHTAIATLLLLVHRLLQLSILWYSVWTCF